jgi:hypothetical protein
MSETNFGRPNESRTLQKDEVVALSTAFELYDPSVIGIPASDRGNSFSIVAEIGLNSEAELGINVSKYVDIALVKMLDPSMKESLFMVVLHDDKKVGKKYPIPGVQWVELPKDRDVVIGRANLNPDENRAFVDGKRLTGIDFPDGISRTHTKIKYTDGAVVVEDKSFNGTSVRGQESAIISSVPKTAQEATAMLTSQLDRVREEHNASIMRALEAIDVKIGQIRDQLSAEDGINLWRFSDSMIGKREAQQMGDGESSYRFEERAMQYHDALSPEAKQVASTYTHLMEEKARIVKGLQ